MVVLQPDEQFTLLSLSAGKPKKPNQIRSLVLLLGPDFCTDTVEVETVDHARLRSVFNFIPLSSKINLEFDRLKDCNYHFENHSKTCSLIQLDV